MNNLVRKKLNRQRGLLVFFLKSSKESFWLVASVVRSLSFSQPSTAKQFGLSSSSSGARKEQRCSRCSHSQNHMTSYLSNIRIFYLDKKVVVTHTQKKANRSKHENLTFWQGTIPYHNVLSHKGKENFASYRGIVEVKYMYEIP